MTNEAMPDQDIDSVRGLIDRSALQWGDKPFMINPETRNALTFTALREQAVDFAQRLYATGLSRGDRVGCLLDNGMFTASFALEAMYAGLVPVPINVIAGQTHLEYVIGHAEPKAVFVSQDYAQLLDNTLGKLGRSIEVIKADPHGGPQWMACAGRQPLAALGENNDGLVLYTSGSTGRPKGALFQHRQLLAIARRNQVAHELSEEDRFLCVLPLYHMNAQETLISTLNSGGTVVLPRRFNVKSYWQWIAEFRCTWSAIVPTIISQLLHWTDPYAEGHGAGLEQIRFLRTSAASIAPALHKNFEKKFRLLLIEVMGATEAGGVFLYTPLTPGKRKIGSPGLPCGFEAKVVDADGCAVPDGSVGEIAVRGPSIMGGYFRDAEATAEALDSEGWLKTGDLVERDAEGYFFVRGRVKEIIIKGGENIAPKEIDQTLEQHPAVLEAAALGVPEAHWGEDIVAYIVRKPGAPCDELQLAKFCEQKIGRFKTPSHIFFVNELPKGPTRKVQRLRLIDDALQRIQAARGPVAAGLPLAHPQRPFVAPRSAVEVTLAAIWMKILNIEQVSIHDNFFALGGDSIATTQVISRLADAFGVQLPLQSLFITPTIAGLGAEIDRVRAAPSASQRAASAPIARQPRRQNMGES